MFRFIHLIEKNEMEVERKTQKYSMIFMIYSNVKKYDCDFSLSSISNIVFAHQISFLYEITKATRHILCY